MLRNAQIATIYGGTFVNVQGNATLGPPGQGGTEEIVDGLKSVNFRAIQTNTFVKHTAGTGEWLLDDPDFLCWKSGKIKAFWITGMPGAGKTVLISMVNDFLEREIQGNPKVLLLQVFCRFNDNLTARDIFAEVTRQIADSAKDEDILSRLSLFHDRHKAQRTTPSTSDFIHLFGDLFPMYDQVMASIDALDEAADEVKEQLLHGFSKLDVSLFITSRPSADLFKDMLDAVHSLRLESSLMIREDIAHFIRTKMTTVPRLKLLVGRNEDRLKAICETLDEKCAGMFLLAALQIELLRRSTNLHQLMKTLDSLPSDLTAMYRATWHRITSQSPEDYQLARKTFMWIIHRYRDVHNPFAIKSLCEALAVDLDTEEYSEDAVPPISLLELVCGGLITVVGDDVRLMHYTTDDFFRLEDDIALQLSPSPHVEMALTCAIFLTSIGFPDKFVDCPDLLFNNDNAGTFQLYAVRWWSYHYVGIQDNIRQTTRAWAICQSKILQPQSRYPIHILDGLGFDADIVDTAGLAHFVAYHGLVLEYGDVIHSSRNEYSAMGCLPIHYLIGGHVHSRPKEALLSPQRIALFKSLLAAGVDVNTATTTGVTLLMLATMQNRDEFTEALLRHPDIDLSRRDDHGRTVLHYAMSSRPSTHAEDLISRCDINVRATSNGVQKTAFDVLLEASKDSLDEDRTLTIIRLFRDHPDFDINLHDSELGSALYAVCHQSPLHSKHVTKALFNHLLGMPEIDVNHQDHGGLTTLHHLIIDHPHPRNSGLVKPLLSHPKVAVSVQDSDGLIPLDYIEIMREDLKDRDAGNLWSELTNLLEFHPSAVASTASLEKKQDAEIIRRIMALRHWADVSKLAYTFND